MRSSPGSGVSTHRPSYLQIDLGALGRNFLHVRELVAPKRVWCVVKADAYGHGAVGVAQKLASVGAEAFAVATVDEGVELREAGVAEEILVMAGAEPAGASAAVLGADSAAALAVRHGLSVAVWRAEGAEALAAAAGEGGEVAVHLKVDTGMGRLGVPMEDSIDAALEVAQCLEQTDRIRFSGVFSNLAAADAPLGEPGDDHTALQIERFRALCAALDTNGILPAERHLANSAAISQHPAAFADDWCTGVRPGLALYGASLLATNESDLEPVMSWHSAVAAVRDVSEGWPLGYGARRRAERGSRIAVVPVGYHDGWLRSLSDRAEVLIAGQRAQVVGAISMDLTLVDITGIPDVHVGDPVVLLGSTEADRVAPVRVEEIAAHAGTIAHEILSRVGQRLPRRFADTS